MHPNQEQNALWNGAAGKAWVDAQATLDTALQPFAELLAAEAAGRSARSVLDIGCGSGATLLAIAQALGPAASLAGIDVSLPLVELARRRAQEAGREIDVVHADAQCHDYAGQRFELLVSRFGVMFFDDPIAAFGQLRRAALPGARLVALTWRHPDENPFMTAAERAAAPLLPTPPARDLDGPGQFAFADPARVGDWLDRAGWQDIAITPLDRRCHFPVEALEQWLLRLGPLGRVFDTLEASAHARLLATVRRAFAHYVDGPEVRFDAACWKICAVAPM